MERLDIYNLAIACFNQATLTAEDLSASPKSDLVATLDKWYMTALRKASQEHDWPFLEVKLKLSEDKGAGRGYAHSYTLPSDCSQLLWADGERYYVSGNTLYSDGGPEAYGYVKSIIPTDENGEPSSAVPEDFYDLVALALAGYIAYSINPKMKTIIMNDYNSTGASLLSQWLTFSRKNTEEDDLYVN